MTDRPKVVVGGRYELGEMLGRGGMAEVRKGLDTRLGRPVAVKRLRTDLASDATFQARFRREAQSSAALNHPSIVAVYDTGEEMSTDGTHVAQPYIVMEYVAGRTLRDILREGRKILPERALEITSDVLSALDYSHRAGIIHRDIKPGNVMLNPAGDVKVMDFGIARAVSDASSTMTQTAAVVGTAQYLSPEQARGEVVDSRSDVYSTGCLLYELLTGRPPFVGDSPVAVAYQHVREPADPPSDHDTSLDPEIDAIVMKALEKRVADRYQSAADMRDDIERYLAGHPVAAPTVPVAGAAVAAASAAPATAYLPSAPAAATGSLNEPVAEDDEDDRPRSMVGWWIAMGLLGIALVVGGYFLLNAMFDDPVEQVVVPDLSGLTESEARAEIGTAGLAVGQIDSRADDEVPQGQVIEQSPAADNEVDLDSEVDFVLSDGPPTIEVPSVIGADKDDARDQLRDLGFRVVVKKEESDEPVDRVLRTDPAAGEQAAENSVVTVFYSDGPEKVPNVVGLTQEEAESKLRDAGFTPSVVTSNDTTEPAGTVIDQSPDKGQQLSQGGAVTIVVSTYVEPTPTPTPTPTETEPPAPDPSPTPTPNP